MPDQTGWHGSRAARRAALLCLLLPALGVLTGRADMVVLGAPLLVGTTLALAVQLGARDQQGAGAVPATAVPYAPAQIGQGEDVDLVVEVALPPGAQAAVVRMPQPQEVPFGVEVTVAAAPLPRRLGTRIPLPLWGIVLLARPDLRVVGADALLLAGPFPGRHKSVRVLPAAGRGSPAPLRPRPSGVVGAHRTRRPGEGLDLLDVREFRPGDRLRRIDWRVSARRGTLHVRRNALDVDADVMVLLDTRLDVGQDVARWPAPPGPGTMGTSSPGSSLDTTVRTALTLARSLLEQGDRVGMVDLSRPRLSVPPGTGRRQLRRLRAQLVGVAVHWQARRLVLRPGAVPPGVAAVLVSPFLDDAVSNLALRLRVRGTEVVAVDVLPAPLDLSHVQADRGGVRELTAARLMLAERSERLHLLAAAGVVLSPGDAPTVARLLRDHARRRQQVGR